MHSAPSVSYPVGRSRFAAALLLGPWVLGLATCIAWRLQSPASGFRPVATAVILVLVGALAAVSWWRMPEGTLAWDQEQWQWPGGNAGSGTIPVVSLDLQHCLLLRWGAGRGATWLWLERATRPEQWADLRRAVYSRATPESLPKARPSAAKS
jgi:toxin CptA